MYANLDGARVFSVIDIDYDTDQDIVAHGQTANDVVWYENTIVLGAENEVSLLAKGFSLSQNYPNPFNPSTTIHYTLPEESSVEITIYDMLGKKVHELVSQKQFAGDYSIQWNGTDHNGNTASAGIYFYQLEAGDIIQTKKMVLMK